MRLIPLLLLPTSPTIFPIGDCDRAYVIYYKENGEWGLEYWDKSEIGTLDGAEIEFTMISYEGSVQK